MKTPDATGEGREMDAVLRAVLQDDLPPDVEERLEGSAAAFMAARRSERLEPPAWWLAFPGRPLLAFSSALMVIAGFALQAAEGRNVSADPLDRLNTVVSSSVALGQAASMECAVTSMEGAGDARDFVIRWDARRGTSVEPAHLVDLAELQAPEELARRMYREWVSLRAEDHPDAGAVAMFFRSGDGRFGYEIWADRASLRPRLIRRIPLAAAPGSGARSTERVARCTWDGEEN